MKKILKAIGVMMLAAIIGIGALCAYDLYEDYRATYRFHEEMTNLAEELGCDLTINNKKIVEDGEVIEITWAETWD